MFTTPEKKYYNTTKPVERWKVYKGYVRDKYHNKGIILSKHARKYLDTRNSNRSYPQYKNELFDEWQNRLSKYIHEGHNIVVDVKTSCGKTWAVNQIVSYETLSTEKATALMVIPNQSILLDTVRDIGENHMKNYKHGTRMLDFSTGKWSSLEDGSLNSQILCLTSEIVLHYLDKRYTDFFKNIRYIVFDEVHLPEISKILWRLSMLPYKCQYILLSATLGDTCAITDELRKYRRDRGIRVIKYGIRPIPLQRVLYKRGIELCNKGLILEKSELDDKTAFTLQLNTNDPTPRDIKKMSMLIGDNSKIPKGREEQYYLGQELAEKFKNSTAYDEYLETENSQITHSVHDADPKTVLTLLQNLFARGMGPVLIFHPNPLECVKLVKQMTAILSNLEDGDEEVRENMRLIRKLEKRAKRKRDKTKWKQEAKNFNEAKERDEVIAIPELCNKWRFPYNDEHTLKGRHISDYIRDGLQYGIGIHIETMKHSLRRQVFDMFRKRAVVVLVADMGLSVGVNLPARSVVLTGNITPTLYQQMGGRAGRRGMDNQGYIIPLVNNTSELLHGEELESTIEGMTPFSFIDTIQFNNNGYDSLKYDMLAKYVSTLDSDDEALYLERYRWLKRTGLIDCKWTKILLELDVDRVIYLIYLLNKGFIHYYCDETLDERTRLDNLILILAYFLDPGLHESDDPENALPALPEIVVEALKPLDDALSEPNKILRLDAQYSNYILKFYTSKSDEDVQRIAAFQLKLFQLLKIVKSLVVTRYYRVEKPDLFYETLEKLDTILWSKCYKLRGVTSGLS